MLAHTIKNSDLKSMVMEVKVKTQRGFHTRIKIGLALIKLAALIIGITIEIEVKNETSPRI